MEWDKEMELVLVQQLGFNISDQRWFKSQSVKHTCVGAKYKKKKYRKWKKEIISSTLQTFSSNIFFGDILVLF